MGKKPPCPICGDPTVYRFWVDEEAPQGCPHDDSWQKGGRVVITDICEQQRRYAEQKANMRKLCPQHFDKNGNILPGHSALMLLEYVTATGEPPHNLSDDLSKEGE